MNREPFAEGEWYHCYNRGVDKRRIFEKTADYERFLMLLYVANSQKRIHLSDFGRNGQGPTLTKVLAAERGAPLVTLGSYCLMPNHFHLLLRPETKGGVPLFLQKVATGYGMYFNISRERNGTLFQGKFKSKHIPNDVYFRRLINYIHSNPAELYEPGWKLGKVKNEKGLRKKLSFYAFSSLAEFLQQKGRIAGVPAVNSMLERPLALNDLIAEAKLFIRQELVKVGP